MINKTGSGKKTLTIRRSIQGILGVLVSVIFIWWIQHSIGWKSLFDSWKMISVYRLAAVFILFLVSYMIRAIRISDYFSLKSSAELRGCVRLVLVHNFFNNMLPMRIGEVAFAVFMRRYFTIGLKQSAPALLWFRFMDFYILAVSGVTLLFFQRMPALIIIIIAGALFCVWLLFWRLRKAGYQWFLQRKGHIFTLLSHCVAAIPDSRSKFVRLWVWTIGNWALKLVIFSWLINQFTRIPFYRGFLGVIAGEFSSVLPIHGFAGAGTYETGAVAGLVSQGAALEQAIIAATNVHLFILSATIISTGIAMLIPFRKDRTVGVQEELEIPL